MTSIETTQTLLETIDLTGQQPIVQKKVIEKSFQVHHLDTEQGDIKMEPSTANNTKKPVSGVVNRRLQKCEICLEAFCKYTCPGCKMKTCCLSCVQKHKHMTGCSGRRERTKFVAKSSFDNFHLLNDYRFLEEANRLADNAKRDYKQHAPNKPHKKEQILTRNVRKSGVHLYRMAKGMKRWKENQSYYNIKEETLFWTMKLVFDGIDEPILTKQAETLTLAELLSKYVGDEISPKVNKDQFAKHIHMFKEKKLKVFFKQEIDPGTQNLRYAELGIEDTIKNGLMNKSVLEYPVFHIVYPENVEKYREEPYLQVPASDSDDGDSDSSSVDEEGSKMVPAAKQRRLDQT